MVTIGVDTAVARIRPVMQRTPNKNATFESTQARPPKTPQILLKSPSKPFKQTGAPFIVLVAKLVGRLTCFDCFFDQLWVQCFVVVHFELTVNFVVCAAGLRICE